MLDTIKLVVAILLKTVILNNIIRVTEFQIRSFFRTFLCALITVGGFYIIFMTMFHLTGISSSQDVPQITTWNTFFQIAALILIPIIGALVTEIVTLKILFKESLSETAGTVGVEHIIIAIIIGVVFTLIEIFKWLFSTVSSLFN